MNEPTWADAASAGRGRAPAALGASKRMNSAVMCREAENSGRGSGHAIARMHRAPAACLSFRLRPQVALPHGVVFVFGLFDTKLLLTKCMRR